jgi:hypothetical protein
MTNNGQFAPTDETNGPKHLAPGISFYGFIEGRRKFCTFSPKREVTDVSWPICVLNSIC